MGPQSFAQSLFTIWVWVKTKNKRNTQTLICVSCSCSEMLHAVHDSSEPVSCIMPKSNGWVSTGPFRIKSNVARPKTILSALMSEEPIAGLVDDARRNAAACRRVAPHSQRCTLAAIVGRHHCRGAVCSGQAGQRGAWTQSNPSKKKKKRPNSSQFPLQKPIKSPLNIFPRDRPRTRSIPYIFAWPQSTSVALCLDLVLSSP